MTRMGIKIKNSLVINKITKYKKVLCKHLLYYFVEFIQTGNSERFDGRLPAANVDSSFCKEKLDSESMAASFLETSFLSFKYPSGKRRNIKLAS